jgi:hypothetical protein
VCGHGARGWSRPGNGGGRGTESLRGVGRRADSGSEGTTLWWCAGAWFPRWCGIEEIWGQAARWQSAWVGARRQPDAGEGLAGGGARGWGQKWVKVTAGGDGTFRVEEK